MYKRKWVLFIKMSQRQLGKSCNNKESKKRTTQLQQGNKQPKKFKAEVISSSSNDEDLCSPLKNRLRQSLSSMAVTSAAVVQEDIIYIDQIQGMQLLLCYNQAEI